MTFRPLAVFILLCAVPVLAQSPAASDAPKGNVRFSADMLDKSIDPCVNFYNYACSKWQAKNPIPGDHAEWGSSPATCCRHSYRS